jgi:hypothetical protein
MTGRFMARSSGPVRPPHAGDDTVLIEVLMKRLLVALLLVAVAFSLSAPAALAQVAREGRVLVTVVDQSGAVIPDATVTIVGLEEATKKKEIPPTKTSAKGIATIAGLAIGRYSIQGEFPGFELGLLRDIRVKNGDNKHVMVLPLQKMTAEITVGRDPQTAASDRASTFGTALTREQVEALSDDPDEMAKQLSEMAGPGAAIRVDSFEGQQLPPKSQIKSIHITRDMFAAENHMAGGLFIDIVTQPGIGALQGGFGGNFYDSALEARNPLIPRKGPAQTYGFSANIRGPVLKEKSTFSLSIFTSSGYSTPNIYAATLAGTRAENVNLRVPTSNVRASGLLDYAITKDQTIRLSFNAYTSKIENQGVGAYDLPERAYSSDNSMYSLRIQEVGPIGRRLFINTRFALNVNDSTSSSAVNAPTIMVSDAFTGGGAQRTGGSHTRVFTLQSDLDYVRGIHSWRAGIQLDGGWYRSDNSSNFLGTFMFESLAAYQAGQPRAYTRRIGNPNISYTNLQAAFYLQDDIRISKSFTLSPGVRIEAQTHLKDYNNIGPRFGVTWAPFKSGKTTLRGSVGIFYDWLNSGTYEQTLRVDGFRQQEINVLNPTYPDPGTFGPATPTNRYLLGDDLRMAENTRWSAGVDQQVTKAMRVSLQYSRVRARGTLVGQNLNGPVNSIRPDPAFANIIETVPDGRSKTQALGVNMSLNLAPPTIGTIQTGPRLSLLRGLTLYGYYTLARSENNTEGAFSVPASGTLSTEWGPSNFDVRHRAQIYFSSQAIKNLATSIGVMYLSGTPYTIRTGVDNNGDLILNDRPSGVGRNTERAAAQWTSWGSFNYVIGFGKRKNPLPPGIFITGFGPGQFNVQSVSQAGQPRYRVIFSAYVDNLTNRANYTNFNGSMTSPFFKKPTNVQGVRTVRFNMNFTF